MDDVAEHTLENGLKVLLRETHAVPLVSFVMWYRVGARNERPGMSGASHWVEHMLFKRTDTLRPGDIGRLVNGVGGTWNGFTTEDTTAYFETVPSQHVELPIRIESDRMANAVFDPDDVASERTVIISEREGHEAEPMFLLAEAIEATAFTTHPYGHGVIGSKADLNRMTRDELYGHYRDFYAPNNALAVVVGDIKTNDVISRLAASFGEIPAGPTPDPLASAEPIQTRARHVEVRHPGPFPILSVCHRVPEFANADFPAVLVLDALLAGPKSGPFGGGGIVRTSRLYRRFVASGLAAAVGTDVGFNIDPSLHWITVILKPGTAREPIAEAVDEVIRMLHDSPPASEELSRAVRQARAKQAIGLEGVTAQAMWLGFLDVADTWRAAQTFTERLGAVTPDDVQRVARAYMCPEQRTTGWFVPAESVQSQHETGSQPFDRSSS